MWPGETEGEETAKVATGDGGGPLCRQEMRVWCQSYSPVGWDALLDPPAPLSLESGRSPSLG